MTEQSKFCPLLSLVSERRCSPCMGKACAWYNSKTKQCALLALTEEVRGITTAIYDNG